MSIGPMKCKNQKSYFEIFTVGTDFYPEQVNQQTLVLFCNLQLEAEK